MKLRRLDEILLAKSMVAHKRDAFVIVTEGRVFVDGQKAVSPGQMVEDKANIEVRPGREFVGRGAYKLEAAIEKFRIDVQGKICADIGAAAGGFVEALLKYGAPKVYAIDVGRGKLALKLREDPRVVVMEETNVLSLDRLPEPINLVTVDVSFTSLRLVLPVVRSWLSEQGRMMALFKPQYEIGDKSLLKHGILRDEGARSGLVEEFRAWLKENRWQELGFMESPIRGSEGNVEYLFYLQLA